MGVKFTIIEKGKVNTRMNSVVLDWNSGYLYDPMVFSVHR